MTGFTEVGYFAIISLFISNLILKYADFILINFFEYIFYPIGSVVSYSNDDNEIRDFEYINNYVTNNSYALKRIPKFIKDSETYLYDDLNRNENKEQFHNHISSGPFILNYNGTLVFGLYNISDGKHIDWGNEIFKKYSIKLFFFKYTSSVKFIYHCRNVYNKKCLSVGLRYKYSVGNQRWAVWKEASFNVPKTIEFSKSDEMIDFEQKIKNFIACKQDYYNINIPYKKTFLLHGLPGTGKSRFTKSIARTYDIPLYEASIGSGHISDTSLRILIAKMEPGVKILLLDEFDCIKTDKTNKRKKESKMEGVSDATEPSKAGWNNLLDAEAYNGLIVVCITNLNLSQLRELYGDAFLRKGRFDYKYEFCKATKKMLNNFVKKKNINVDKNVISYLDNKLTMSHIQSIYNENYKCLGDVEAGIIKLFNIMKANEKEKNNGFTIIECENNEVSNLLKNHKLEEYITTFTGRKINTLKQFKLLGDGNLKEDLGIPLGDRLLINSIINDLKETEKDKKKKE